ncbi:ABC transporter substrate-binding protein [Candidatus Bipolaricaulota bacterium]|nr:ABC transporter substrate-binding protein [Candidatus Bipolaricaulota bacterium]
MKKALFVLLATAFVFGAAQVLVMDQAGREVLVPAHPTRIASAFGVATAYLYPLISGERIVAARYLGIPDHPLSRAVMFRIDPAYLDKALGGEVTAEELVARKVDLVFAGLKHKDLAALLEEVGIPTVLIGPETFEAVKEATLLIGQALGEEAKAQELVAFYQEILDRISAATAEIAAEARPKVLVVGTAPLRAASGTMYQSRMVELAGGIPVTQGLPGSWQNVNIEQVLIWNPDVIIIVPYSPVEPTELLRDPIWAAVEAVKSGRVYKMPQLLFSWDTPIPESVLGILWMAELFHPGLVPLDLAATIRHFYQEFYRCELSAEELSTLFGR